MTAVPSGWTVICFPRLCVLLSYANSNSYFQQDQMLSLTLKCWYKNARILKTVLEFSLWKEKVSNQSYELNARHPDVFLMTINTYKWKSSVLTVIYMYLLSNQRFCYAVLLWNMYHEGNENSSRIILAVQCPLNKKIYKIVEKVLHEIFGSGQQENVKR